MDIYKTMKLPCAEFGEGKKRQVRIIASPETTGEKNVTLVHVTIPAGGKSEGHSHAGYDEYILFESSGRAILDGVPYDVPPQGVVHARRGVVHECINTSQAEPLMLFCVFTPPLVPYGAYPFLIQETKEYLKQLKGSL
jgi:quercetin dioxygenase-like cupin family protein